MSKVTLSVAGMLALNRSAPLYQVTTIANGRRVTAYFLEKSQRDALAERAACHPLAAVVCRDWSVLELREVFALWDRATGHAPPDWAIGV